MDRCTNVQNVARAYACLAKVCSPPRSMTSQALGVWLEPDVIFLLLSRSTSKNGVVGYCQGMRASTAALGCSCHAGHFCSL